MTTTMITTADQIQQGDVVTYCGATFTAHEVLPMDHNSLVRVDTGDSFAQYIWGEREVTVTREGEEPEPEMKRYNVVGKDVFGVRRIVKTEARNVAEARDNARWVLDKVHRVHRQ